MTNIQILAAFEREINQIDDTLNKPATDDSLYWINQAVYKFCKTRFNGNAPHFTSYEQNEKRTKDLINLFVSSDLDLSSVDESRATYNKYTVAYPKNMMFVLNEDVVIDSINDGHQLDTSVFECTADSFMYRVNNTLTDFHYRHYKARPLRIKTQTGCDLLTDKKYKITKYTLGYLRNPNKISLDDPKAEYSDFPDVIMPEIIKIAAQMYIESQIPMQQRYQTISNEVNTQE